MSDLPVPIFVAALLLAKRKKRNRVQSAYARPLYLGSRHLRCEMTLVKELRLRGAEDLHKSISEYQLTDSTLFWKKSDPK